MDRNKSTIASDFLSIFKGLKATAKGDEHFIYLKEENIIIKIRYITKENLNDFEFYYYANILPNADDAELVISQFFPYSTDGFYTMCSWIDDIRINVYLRKKNKI